MTDQEREAMEAAWEGDMGGEFAPVFEEGWVAGRIYRAALAPSNVREVKRVAGALRSWAESSENRPHELTVEGAEFAVRMADDLCASLVRDTDRPDDANNKEAI